MPLTLLEQSPDKLEELTSNEEDLSSKRAALVPRNFRKSMDGSVDLIAWSPAPKSNQSLAAVQEVEKENLTPQKPSLNGTQTDLVAVFNQLNLDGDETFASCCDEDLNDTVGNSTQCTASPKDHSLVCKEGIDEQTKNKTVDMEQNNHSMESNATSDGHHDETKIENKTDENPDNATTEDVLNSTTTLTRHASDTVNNSHADKGNNVADKSKDGELIEEVDADDDASIINYDELMISSPTLRSQKTPTFLKQADLRLKICELQQKNSKLKLEVLKREERILRMENELAALKALKEVEF